MKRCPECGEDKPTGAFGRNRTRPDGLSFYCLECNRRRNGDWYRRSRAAAGQSVRDHSWVPEGFRWCPGCRQAVEHRDFSRNSRQTSGFGSVCRACNRRSANEAYWKRRHGLTRADVAALRAEQGDSCAICGAPEPEHLDHDHLTGRIRALLCQRCNQGLGLLRDDPSVLRAAADYVEEHREDPADVTSGVRVGAGILQAPSSSPGLRRWRAMYPDWVG
jgi:hypothetical protein